MIVQYKNRSITLITSINIDTETGSLDKAYYLDTNEELTKAELFEVFELYHQEINADAASYIKDLMGRN